jgi:hypothetical protein
VTAAALLHDVGHMLLPREIQGMPEPLLDERGKAVFRQHPFAGARALFALGAPPLWVAAALEHHRGVDGAGYPSLGTKDPPHELVRLVSLANFFDRRRTLLRGQQDEPEDAVRRAAALEGRYFDRKTLRRFCRALGVYPPGTTVQLTDEQAAVVARVNPSDPLRPEVTLLCGPNAGKRVDLKAINAVERRHELSIIHATMPPLLVRAQVKGVVSAAPAPEPLALEVSVEAPPPSGSFAAPPPVSASFAAPRMPSATSIPVAPRISEAPARTGRDDPRAEGADVRPDRYSSSSRLVIKVPPKTQTQPSLRIDPRLASMEEAAAAGELEEALFLAEAILATDPSNAAAHVCAERCRGGLKLPPPSVRAPAPASSQAPAPAPPPVAIALDAVFAVAMSPAQLKAVPLDAQAGFVLSLLDGMSPLETILDMCGMPKPDLLRIVDDLARRGVVKIL